VLEKLYQPIFTEKLYQQALDFLSLLQMLNAKHNDISISNVMMDKEGDLKLIDFSGYTVTPGYFGTDCQNMATVLFELKNQERLQTLARELPQRKKRPPEKRINLQMIRIIYTNAYGSIEHEKWISQWLLPKISMDEQNYKLLQMMDGKDMCA
jgi:thiamine kinase-like enzyme